MVISSFCSSFDSSSSSDDISFSLPSISISLLFLLIFINNGLSLLGFLFNFPYFSVSSVFIVTIDGFISLLLIKRTKKKQITFSNNVKTSTTPHHHKNKQSNTRNSGKSAQNSTNNTKKVNSKRLMESSSNSLTRFLTPTKFANQPAKIYPMSSLRFTRTSFLAKNDMRYWITSARLLVRRSLIAMTALVIIVKPQLQI